MGAVEDNAKEALLNLKFTDFFNIISMADSFTRSQLTEEAVEVASVHGNVNALRQLACIDTDIFFAERLLEAIFKALVKLKAIEIITAIVVFSKTTLPTDKKWYLFATALLDEGDLPSINDIFGYIKEPHQKCEIANGCLNKLTPADSLLAWLEWLDRYAEHASYIPSDLLATTVSALSNSNNFSEMYLLLAKIKSTNLKDVLIEKLYLTLINERKEANLHCLEQHLTDEQRWLTRLRRLPEDESHFDAVKNIRDPADARRLILPAITNLAQRGLQQEEKKLAQKVIEIAETSPRESEFIIQTACAACIRFNRNDAVIFLLAKLTGYDRIQQMLLLTERELTLSQYQILVSLITTLPSPDSCRYYESAEDKLLKRIPLAIVAEERKRRAQQFVTHAQTAYSNAKNVSTRHPHFNTLCDTVTKLFEHDELEVAFSLCQKLVPCKKRDQFAKQLFRFAVTRGNYALARNSCLLIIDTQYRKNLVTFIQQHQNKHYRRALSCLMRTNNRIDYLLYIYECANTILTQEEDGPAARYLEDIGILTLSEHCEDEELAKTIKKRILGQLLSGCKNTNELNRLVMRLKKYSIDEVQSSLLSILLERDNLEAGIYLLNLHVTEQFGRHALPEKLAKKIEKYLKAKGPTVHLLRILSQINSPHILSDLVRWSFKPLTLEYARDNLNVIAVIPDEEIKLYYLIETIILSICVNEFKLAEHAAKFLNEKNKAIWLQIIKHARDNNPGELLTLFQLEIICDDRLIKWVTTRWLSKTKSQQSVIDYLLQIIKQLLVLKQAPPTETYDTYQTYIRKISLFRSIFSHIFQTWHHSLKQLSAYEDIVAGIAVLLPEAKKVDLERPLLMALQEAIEWLIDHSPTKILAAIKLLLEYETSFPDYFLSKIIDKLLNQRSLNIACGLLDLVDRKNCFWLETSALKIAEGYYQQGDFNALVKLLNPYQDSYTAHNTVTNWVVSLIDKGELKNAKYLIDNLLTKSYEKNFESIINTLIAKKHVRHAFHLLSRIKTPALQLRLKQALQKAYLEKLEDWIGQERAHSLHHAYQKLLEFRQLIKLPNQQSQANRIKNEIIVELRSQLDKAFLSYYRTHIGAPPMRGANPVNVYFPVVPELEGKTVPERLQEYFANLLRTPTFSTRCPEVYAFLLQIQPLHNPAYIWLRQLYKFANVHKHDIDLPLQPTIDGTTIDMIDYLPRLLNGTHEVLLHLFHPHWGHEIISELSYTRFLPLEPIKLETRDIHYDPRHFRSASPPKPSPLPLAAPIAKTPITP